jgi:hypothetical protein
VVQDTGQYHKDRDRWFYFQRSPGAHSTLVVDGEQIDSQAYPPYGSGIYAWGGPGEDGWYAVWARNPIVENRGVFHARLFLYKPGYALIVADAVVSNVLHGYRRNFQIGHQLTATQAGPELLLSGRGFDGALTSHSSAGEGTLRTVRGQEEPLAGWYFPRFRKRIARTTASWQTAGQSVDHLATFSLDGPDLRAELETPLGDDTTIVLRDGKPTEAPTDSAAKVTKLRVVQTGNAVTVEETP